jgi:hypothetical protein
LSTNACCIGCSLPSAARPLDGGDVVAFRRQSEREARQHAPLADQHGAGPALAVIATLLASGETEMLAQRIEHGRARVDVKALVLAIHAQRDVDGQRRILHGR